MSNLKLDFYVLLKPLSLNHLLLLKSIHLKLFSIISCFFHAVITPLGGGFLCGKEVRVLVILLGFEISSFGIF